MVIKIPKYLTHNNFNIILGQYENILKEAKNGLKELIFDTSDTEYISILGILLIEWICDSVNEKCKCLIHYGKPKKESFIASIMGIMGAVKRDNSQDIEKYLDDFRVPVQRCLDGNENLKAVNKVIHIIKKEFNPSGDILRALNWALWELVDNAGMHGYRISEFNQNYPSPVYFCAFDYKESVEIAILDSGQGIHRSFLSSGKKKYEGITNAEALQLSIRDKESGNPEGSTGFGLFGCSEIAKQSGGELVIISGNNKIVVSNKGAEVSPYSNFNGTMVSLSMPREAIINLKSIFGEKGLIFDSLNDLFGGVE